MEAFEAYKQMYTDEVMPLLAGQKTVEAALQEAEPRAALDAEVTHCLMYSQNFTQSCMETPVTLLNEVMGIGS